MIELGGITNNLTQVPVAPPIPEKKKRMSTVKKVVNGQVVYEEVEEIDEDSDSSRSASEMSDKNEVPADLKTIASGKYTMEIGNKVGRKILARIMKDVCESLLEQKEK